jgi:UPF0716 protein FxsA
MEIAAFVIVGSHIGVLPTIGLAILTTIVGAILLRVQGFGVVSRIRAEMDAGRVPGRELTHGVMIMIAGLLLIVPGFMTDVVGLLLFIPPIRDMAWNFVKSRITVITSFGGGAGGFGYGGPRRDGAPTIDLDEDEYSRAPDPSSPWRKPELK